MSNLIVGWVKDALVEVIQDERVTSWVDARVKVAVDQAMSDGENALNQKADELKAALLQKVDDFEGKAIGEIEALPGKIIGEGFDSVFHVVSEVTGTGEEIAGKVKDQVQPLFGTLTGALGKLPIPGIGGILGDLFGGQQ